MFPLFFLLFDTTEYFSLESIREQNRMGRGCNINNRMSPTMTTVEKWVLYWLYWPGEKKKKKSVAISFVNSWRLETVLKKINKTTITHLISEIPSYLKSKFIPLSIPETASINI